LVELGADRRILMKWHEDNGRDSMAWYHVTTQYIEALSLNNPRDKQ